MQSPDVGRIPIEVGKTHAGNAGAPSAPGTLQHIAFNVDTEAELLAMRDRIRSRGVHVLGHIDHGFCKSIYFAGPENLTLEVATSEGRAIDPGAWIDPEVVALAGISPAELAQYRSPARFEPPARPVSQPAPVSGQPQLVYPSEIYNRLVTTPDETILAQASQVEPPVKPPL